MGSTGPGVPRRSSGGSFSAGHTPHGAHAQQSESIWGREFDTILIDLDDTLYHVREIPRQVCANIQGARARLVWSQL
jgi:hypothetical protein